MAEFRSPRANVVESDSGIAVEVLGRTGIRYTERGRSCFVDSEVLAIKAIAIWPSGIRSWDSPHEHEPLTEADRERILANIAEAFASQNWGLEIIRR
jgi:Immunity protein 74